MSIEFIIYLLIYVNIFLIFLHESTDLSFFESINDVIRNNKLKNSIYIDVYSESNDIATGRDDRAAIVHPFNWFLLNSRSNVYIYSTLDDYGSVACGTNKHEFIKLTHPSFNGGGLKNIYKVCLPVTVSSMATHFADKPKARLFFEPKKKIDIIDVVDFLLERGAFTNSLRTI